MKKINSSNISTLITIFVFLVFTIGAYLSEFSKTNASSFATGWLLGTGTLFAIRAILEVKK